MEKSKDKEAIPCAGCMNNISEPDEFVTAAGGDWHQDCFRCSVCDVSLCEGRAAHARGPLLLCAAHYWPRYGDSCRKCDLEPLGAPCPACRSRHAPVVVQPGRPRVTAKSTTEEPTTNNNNNNPPTIEISIEKENIPEHSKEDKEVEGKKERLFKRKGDGAKGRGIKRRQGIGNSGNTLSVKERSSSMPKLLDGSCEGGSGGEMEGVDGCAEDGVLNELSRCRSFRTPPRGGGQHEIYRDEDFVQGELLGAGFFGAAYLVTHRATGRRLVLKQLSRLDDTAQRNFLKEVAVLRSLFHPNVLRYAGVLYRDKRLQLLTEYIAGGTLHQLLQDTSVELGWGSRGRLARDVARGVGYLHRRGLIHRDLNSHNCLVREDRTVVVADFGLARIVRRSADGSPRRAHHTLRRKRYTVVGNPYWMAPEMMNGQRYDERVDIFSFGIILCEIIGRVYADPDFLPRRSDFGLNEAAFLEQFCCGCPEPLYRVAFLACQIDPDKRPPFEVLEIWLESLALSLADRQTNAQCAPAQISATTPLLHDILQYGMKATHHGARTPETPNQCCQHTPDSAQCCQHSTARCCQHQDSIFGVGNRGAGDGRCCRCLVCYGERRLSKAPSGEFKMPQVGVVKSLSSAVVERGGGAAERWALGKCPSASHVGRIGNIGNYGPGVVTVTDLRRAGPWTRQGFILRSRGKNINITKVDDITAYLEPSCSRASPTPAFLRNQSVELLQTQREDCRPFCRHHSIPGDNDSSDEDLDFYRGKWQDLTATEKRDTKMEVDKKMTKKEADKSIAKKVKEVLPKKKSYDVSDVKLRDPPCPNERKIQEVDFRRFNIDHLTKSHVMAEGVKNISKVVDSTKPTEKPGFFSKKLLSPRLSRLFKPSGDVQISKPESSEEKSRSKFFIQRPASPSVGRGRIRPVEKTEDNVLKSDLKLASLGKPMTPIFRRHIPENPNFADGRYSCRERRTKYDIKEPKFLDVGRNRIKTPINADNKLAPLLRSSHTNNIPALATVPEKKQKEKAKPGISRSNYVSLANLKISSTKEMQKAADSCDSVERAL